ncbi:hypothetical protein M1105_17975 [Limibaculum sp. FT325]|uniref:hypothetical protein n=1 Tax=Thermohalobaculum sediminis TaxID=2939436 RepID=UPI0020BFE5FB|nr:hypothetical protein [Limibaculum sediminis]MCL5778865.1 hypothetical protein [Limibaculum sediminis]
MDQSDQAAQDTKHVARFTQLSVYNGIRKEAVPRLQSQPNTEGGHVDLARGLIYGRSAFTRESSKSQPPVRIPRQRLGHLHLWRGLSRQYVVENFDGMPLGDIKTAWREIHERAGVDYAKPHTTRHTAITWAMNNRADPVAAGSLFRVSLQMLSRAYLHHHPDHRRSAVEAMERKSFPGPKPEPKKERSQRSPANPLI